MLSSPSSDLQRPLAMLSFAANHYFTGLAPGPMKTTNILVHLFNTVLVFGLLTTLCRALPGTDEAGARRRRFVVLFCSAGWALAPINLMAVLFVVQRMESLCHLFVFAGLWLYISGRLRQRDGRGGLWLVLLGLIGGTGLGVLAKESAVLLPVYALSLELTLFQFRSNGARDRSRDHTLCPRAAAACRTGPELAAAEDAGTSRMGVARFRPDRTAAHRVARPLELSTVDGAAGPGPAQPLSRRLSGFARLAVAADDAHRGARSRRAHRRSDRAAAAPAAEQPRSAVVSRRASADRHGDTAGTRVRAPQLFCVAGRAAGGGRRAAAVHLASGAAPRYSGPCRGPAGVLDRCHRTTRARME